MLNLGRHADVYGVRAHLNRQRDPANHGAINVAMLKWLRAQQFTPEIVDSSQPRLQIKYAFLHFSP